MKLIVGILVAVIIIFFVVRSRQSKPTGERRSIPRPIDVTSTSTFHAVSIICPDSACAAAKALQGTRVLSNEAPQLPLADCDVSNCECRFSHHKDRRGKNDRRDPYREAVGGETGKFKKEQRHRRDRRNSDPDDYFG